MSYDFSNAKHLPKTRGGRAADPEGLPRQRQGVTPQLHGRYPDYDVLSQAPYWDEVTRRVVLERVNNPPPIRFFNADEARTLSVFCDTVTGQDREPRVPVLNYVDEKMNKADECGLDGYQYADMPDDRETWRLLAKGLDDEAKARGHASFADAPKAVLEEICDGLAKNELGGNVWKSIPRAWKVVTRSVLEGFYGHPWAWNEIGFGGPAYPRAYTHFELGSAGVAQKEPWERPEADDTNPEYTGKDHGGASSSHNKSNSKSNNEGHDKPVDIDHGKYRREAKQAAEVAEKMRAHDPSFANRLTQAKKLLKGANGPKDNRSRYLLDVHQRGVPGAATMRRYRDDDAVDLLIVGCGAGGGTLAQRLAREGWRIVVLESGPFWNPDDDWVSDEKGSAHIYWNKKRIIGGQDPVELGKNNSGHGVGGSMIHYAGYTPRFHPSDFQIHTLDGVGVDWPISYWDVKRHYERVEAELPVSGQDWPWGDPHRYTFSAHPISGAADRVVQGALKFGVEMLVGPVGIPNGTFGNRPHCIYRGFCLQGCKVNAKASPLVTHVPDAIDHGTEIRANSTAVRVEIDEAGRATGVTYIKDGEERFQRAQAVAIAGYSIESPRLLLNSSSQRFPNGLGNLEDQVGRYVMVQGAPQIGGAFSRAAADVQSAAARGLLRAVLRNRPPARLQTGLFYPDRRAFADWLGRTRAGRRTLGRGAARVHARL